MPENNCPCVNADIPCQFMCTCHNPVYSAGCLNCTRHWKNWLIDTGTTEEKK